MSHPILHGHLFAEELDKNDLRFLSGGTLTPRGLRPFISGKPFYVPPGHSRLRRDSLSQDDSIPQASASEYALSFDR